MTQTPAQKQGEPGTAASRLVDLGKKVALASGAHRQAGSAGKRASAEAFRALTAKVDEVRLPPPLPEPVLPEPPVEPPHPANGYANVEPELEPQSFAPDDLAAAIELPPGDEIPVESKEIHAEAPSEWQSSELPVAAEDDQDVESAATSKEEISTDGLLALIRDSLTQSHAQPVAHLEPERSESVDDMLAVIRAAIFSEADPAVAEGEAHAELPVAAEVPETAAADDAPQPSDALASDIRDLADDVVDVDAAMDAEEKSADSSAARPLLKVEFVATPGQTQQPLRFVIEPPSTVETPAESDASIDESITTTDTLADDALAAADVAFEPIEVSAPDDAVDDDSAELTDVAASLPLVNLDLAAAEDIPEVETAIADASPEIGEADVVEDETAFEAQSAQPESVWSPADSSEEPVAATEFVEEPVEVPAHEPVEAAADTVSEEPFAPDQMLEVDPAPATDEPAPEPVADSSVVEAVAQDIPEVVEDVTEVPEESPAAAEVSIEDTAAVSDALAEEASAVEEVIEDVPVAAAAIETSAVTENIATAVAEIEAATAGIQLAPVEPANEPVPESDARPMEVLHRSEDAVAAPEEAPRDEAAAPVPDVVEVVEHLEETPPAVEVITPGNRTRSNVSPGREVRSLTRDFVAAAMDEFAATYDEFAAPRPVEEPAKPDGEDETAGLARPPEFKFWEQDPAEDTESEEKVDAAAVYAVIPEIAADLPAARAALSQPELPSDQAGQIAQSLLDIMSLTSHSVQPQERALASDTLLHLLHRLPLKILVTIAERLSITDQPPARIVTRLIRDPRIEVAGPLLEKCNSIGDQDLIGVIAEGHIQNIRVIARRRALSPALCDALIATREPSTVLTLVRNPGAELSHTAFFRLNELARAYASLQAPLATRSDLPAPVAFELFWVLPAELRRYVLSRFLADSLTLERILRITKSVGGESEPETMAMRFPPRHKIEAFIASLIDDTGADPAAELSELAGIDPGTASRIIADKHGDPLAIAFKALGLQRARFAEVLEILRSSSGRVHLECSSEELQNLFDSLSFNKARVLLTYWDWAVSGTGPYAELAR